MAYTPHEVGSRSIVVADNRQIETLFIGEGSRPLVYLHGSGTEPGDYAQLLNYVASKSPDRQIIAPSKPGVGESDSFREGDSMAGWLMSFLESAHITDADIEDVKVVGHSYGGWLAFEAGRAHPDLSVYSMGTPVGEQPKTSTLVHNLLSDHMKFVVNAAQHGNVVPLRKTTSQTLAASYEYLTNPDQAKRQSAIIEAHMAHLATPESVAVRQAMLRSGQATAAFYEFDTAVRPPLDWRGIVEIPGGHMDPVYGPVEPTARFIFEQAQVRAA